MEVCLLFSNAPSEQLNDKQMHDKIVFCKTYFVLESHMSQSVGSSLEMRMQCAYYACSTKPNFGIHFFLFFLDLSFVYPVPSLLLIVCSASCWHTVCQYCHYRCLTGFCNCHYYCYRSIQLNFYYLFQFLAWTCASKKKQSKMLLYV